MTQVLPLKSVGPGRAEIVKIAVGKVFRDRREHLQTIFSEPDLIIAALLLKIPNHAIQDRPICLTVIGIIFHVLCDLLHR